MDILNNVGHGVVSEDPGHGAPFDYWWHNSDGTWVEPANQRRGGESGVLRLNQQGGNPLYCKRQTGHLYRSVLHPLGRPTILRELQCYRALARLGIRVPELVFAGARKQDGGWQALLVTEALTGFVSLEQWYAGQGTEPRDRSRSQPMLRELAVTLARLHLAGWQHGCCYPKHIFIKTVPDAQEPAPQVDIALLDLEKSRWRLRTRDASRRDLGQLCRHRGDMPWQDWTYLEQAYNSALAHPFGSRD